LQSWTAQSAPCSDIVSPLPCTPCVVPYPTQNLETLWAETIFSLFVCAMLGLVLIWGSGSPLLLAVITVTKLGLEIILSSRQGFLIFQEIMLWLPPICVPPALPETSSLDVAAQRPCLPQCWCNSFSVFAPDSSSSFLSWNRSAAPLFPWPCPPSQFEVSLFTILLSCGYFSPIPALPAEAMLWWQPAA